MGLFSEIKAGTPPGPALLVDEYHEQCVVFGEREEDRRRTSVRPTRVLRLKQTSLLDWIGLDWVNGLWLQSLQSASLREVD